MKKIELIESFSSRTYQQSVFANSLNKNSLVILPTGLGKTVIAIMLSMYYFNKNNKKILFLAPTKPLVEQQEKSFKGFFKNSDEFIFNVLTGLVSPAKRKGIYEESDFIFSTPQLIENDIINKIISPQEFSLVIFDEAHRTSGNYAYTFIAKEFNEMGVKSLALTASPGSNIEEIKQIIQNLNIEQIELKRYEDEDVRPYVKETKIKNIKIDLTPEIKNTKEKLDLALNKRLKHLQELGFLQKKNIKYITKKDLLELQTYLRVMITQGNPDENIWKAISTSAAIMKLLYGIELFESQDISVAHNYFYNLFREGGDQSKAAQELIIDIDFKEAFEKIAYLHKKDIRHPKLIKLKEIVNEEILKNKELKIIIFNQYRESAQKIVDELSKIKEIKPALFVGQAKKGEFKLSQKQQKQILDDFRENKYNILVSTSVGEEGLDIPKVDLVIFYEPIPSAIRTIQRIGRTGRFKEGNAYILITNETKDVITRHVANAKEKSMYKALERIKDEINKESKETGLSKFIKTNNNNDNNKQEDNKDINYKSSASFIPKIFIDNRENTDLIKELYKKKEINIETKSLDIGDVVISENIAIERKSKKDFVNSIIDKRLFPQLLDLAKNYKRPLLIIEGEENIYSIRNLNPNVIRSTLSAIAIDLRIPIIYTHSMQESAEMITTITKRTYRDKNEISLVANKSSINEDQELEKFVSSIPKINAVTAKQLLTNFKTIKDLINSSQKELEKCERIGKIRAKYLVKFFEREYKNN